MLWKARDLIEKIRLLRKVQRKCLRILVPKQETMEKQAQGQEMMASHKGLASHWSILDLLESSFYSVCILYINILTKFH